MYWCDEWLTTILVLGIRWKINCLERSKIMFPPKTSWKEIDIVTKIVLQGRHPFEAFVRLYCSANTKKYTGRRVVMSGVAEHEYSSTEHERVRKLNGTAMMRACISAWSIALHHNASCAVFCLASESRHVSQYSLKSWSAIPPVVIMTAFSVAFFVLLLDIMLSTSSPSFPFSACQILLHLLCSLAV